MSRRVAQTPAISKGLILIVSLAAGLFPPLLAEAGEWRVTPIRLDLGRESKTGVITVVNEREERLQVQMKAFEWSQDAEGKDVYVETAEVVFFPRIMVFDKKDEKIIRAGIRNPAAKTEKTYRLFIEEIPEPRKAEGTNVAIAIRIGVPIFVKPLKEEPRGEIGSVDVSRGAFRARVRNTGNVHFIIRSVVVRGKDAAGAETFSKELSGWYLLAGAERTYAAEVPPEKCPDTAAVEVEVKADKLTLTGRRDTTPEMCAP